MDLVDLMDLDVTQKNRALIVAVMDLVDLVDLMDLDVTQKNLTLIVAVMDLVDLMDLDVTQKNQTLIVAEQTAMEVIVNQDQMALMNHPASPKPKSRRSGPKPMNRRSGPDLIANPRSLDQEKTNATARANVVAMKREPSEER